MNTVVLVRASWPSPLCGVGLRGEHTWIAEGRGLECDRCRELLPWAECGRYQAWCYYVAMRRGQLDASLN